MLLVVCIVYCFNVVVLIARSCLVPSNCLILVAYLMGFDYHLLFYGCPFLVVL